MKNRLLVFLYVVYSIGALAQTNSSAIVWTKINMSIPDVNFVPRELFKINDTTLYLGSRFFLSKVKKDSLDIQFSVPKTTQVIRSVVSYKNTKYISVSDGSIFFKTDSLNWKNMLKNEPSKVYYGWEMIEYKSELISTAWPRWVSTYNFETQTWTSSAMLDTRGAGYVSDFTKTDKNLFVSLYGGGVFKKCHDDWLNCNKGLPENLNVRSVLAVNNKKIFAATEHGIYFSTLKKIKWKPCKQTQNQNIKFVDIMYYDGILYTTGVNGEFMYSADMGENWKQVNINNAEGYVLYSVEVIGSNLYFSADGQGKKPSGVFTIPIAEIFK